MKKNILFFSLLLASNFVFSQDKVKSEFGSDVSIDTICKPDFYTVKIIVSEHRVWVGKGKKEKSIFVNIDSVEVLLKNALNTIKYNKALNRTKISQTIYDQYQNRNPTTSATYEFILLSKDSIIPLFNALQFKWVSGLEIKPKLTSEHENSLELFLYKKAEKISQNQATTFANSHNLNLDYVIKFRKRFYQNNKNEFNNEIKEYQITFEDISFQLYVDYIYALK